ncbi:hypothetical protein PR048_007934 [Dryococelus australis]|uniref:Uncharacterized protein n=1 Tax=Dryococelus australis TaxID=614101 RepID=A0ABQ9HWI3_9NEOP|nr:hypothetical protein PR048_007934 [Dryococelus australis]
MMAGWNLLGKMAERGRRWSFVMDMTQNGPTPEGEKEERWGCRVTHLKSTATSEITGLFRRYSSASCKLSLTKSGKFHQKTMHRFPAHSVVEAVQGKAPASLLADTREVRRAGESEREREREKVSRDVSGPVSCERRFTSGVGEKACRLVWSRTAVAMATVRVQGGYPLPRSSFHHLLHPPRYQSITGTARSLASQGNLPFPPGPSPDAEFNPRARFGAPRSLALQQIAWNTLGLGDTPSTSPILEIVSTPHHNSVGKRHGEEDPLNIIVFLFTTLMRAKLGLVSRACAPFLSVPRLLMHSPISITSQWFCTCLPQRRTGGVDRVLARGKHGGRSYWPGGFPPPHPRTIPFLPVHAFTRLRPRCKTPANTYQQVSKQPGWIPRSHFPQTMCYPMWVIEVKMERRRNEGAGKREIPEETLRSVGSYDTIPTC